MRKLKARLQRWGRVVLGATKGFMHNDAFMHAAALSYYSVFALPSLFILMMNSAKFFISQNTLESEVFKEISIRLGDDVAEQIRQMIVNLEDTGDHYWAGVVSVVVILFTASAAFYALQRSLNSFWKVKHITQKAIVSTLVKRGLSLVMIFLLMLLLLLSVGLETLINYFKDYILDYFPDLSLRVFQSAKFGINLLIKMITFVCVYKYLTDGVVRWKVAIVGAFYSALLFQLGDLGIGWYISEFGVSDKFGAAGSILLLFTWVYYSALVIFYGAHITYVYGKIYKMPIVSRGGVEK